MLHCPNVIVLILHQSYDMILKLQVLACSEFSGLPTPIQFMNLVAASKPAIFKGAIRNWKAVTGWTNEQLASKLPNVNWKAAVSPHGNFDCVEPAALWSEGLDKSSTAGPAESAVDVGAGIDAEVASDGSFDAGINRVNKSAHMRWAIARPGSVLLSTDQFMSALKRKNTQDPWIYVEYAHLPIIKREIADAGLDPGSFFGDLGRAFKRPSPRSQPDPAAAAAAPDGASDLRFADFLYPSSRLLWLGTGDTIGNLHFDRHENLMAVVRGAKTFTLFDPLQSKALYAGTPLQEARYRAEVILHDEGGPNLGLTDKHPFSIRVGRTLSDSQAPIHKQKSMNGSCFSPVNITDPNVLEEFPAFANASPVKCRAEAGDLLFVPSRWWHEVQSEPDDDGKTAAINWWYKPWYHKLGFEDGSPHVIRNEHYVHLHGERRSALPCKDDPAFVCWLPK